MSNETVHAYAAGFFDGEGNIYIAWNYRGVRVNATQATVEPLRLLQKTYGGKIYTHNQSHWQGFQWNLNKRADVRAFLALVLPYLIVKREAAERAIEILDAR